MTTESSLTFVGEATPYTYLGDSHASIGTLVFEDSDTHERIATRQHFIWAFAARDFIGDDGMLGATLVEALRRTSALNSSALFTPLPGFRPVQTWRDGILVNEFVNVMGSSRNQPYVICAGELNVRYLLGRFADDQIDFDVPFLTNGLDALPDYDVRATVPFAKLLPVVLEEIGPIFRGLKILRDAGLETLYLHSLPPPTLDDTAFGTLLGFQAPARLRYKLTMLVNFLFERACGDLNVGFINTWSGVTERNLRKTEFELDAVHLNRKHAVLSVAELHRKFHAARNAQ